MKGMEEAVARVKKAVSSKEHVAVYGDYDADGITSACMTADYFHRKGLECDIFIPERLGDGYGVKKCGVDELKSRGVSLIITVDCGVTAVEEAEYARSLGMDMIITDHHECGQALPASAVIDPKRKDCPYPDKALAGCGVAFKFLCAVEGEDHTEELLERYGDLVAIGTIADVMPVTGENRILIRKGMEIVRSGARPGLRKLCEAAGIETGKAGVTNVGFAIAAAHERGRPDRGHRRRRAAFADGRRERGGKACNAPVRHEQRAAAHRGRDVRRGGLHDN